MNEQALQDAYQLFKEGGYNGSIQDFTALINENPDALNDSYDLFSNSGYNGSIEDYSTLIGVKKKDSSVSIVEEKPVVSELEDGSAESFQEVETFEPDSTYQAPTIIPGENIVDIDGNTINTSVTEDGVEIEETVIDPENLTFDDVEVFDSEENVWLEDAFGKNFLTDLLGDQVRAWRQGQAQGGSVDEALELFGKGANVTDQDIADFIKAQKELQSAGTSDEMKDFQKIYKRNGGGWLGFTKGVLKNPSLIPSLFTSSMSAMFNPTVLAGATIGGATGGAVGSLPGAFMGAIGGATLTLEAGLSFAEFLQEEIGEGVELTNDNIRKVLEDPEAMNSIRRRAAGRGIAIGLIDGITGGIATKVVGTTAKGLQKAKRMGDRASKLAGAGAGIATEAVGGSLGEVGGRVVAGQEMDVAEIGFEGIAGLTTAPLTVGLGLYKAPVYKINGSKVPGWQMVDLIEKGTPAEISGAKISITNDSSLLNEAKSKKDNAMQSALIRGELLEAGVQETKIEELTQLELQKRKYKNNKTEAGKRKLKEIQNKIDNILDVTPEETTIVEDKVDVNKILEDITAEQEANETEIVSTKDSKANLTQKKKIYKTEDMNGEPRIAEIVYKADGSKELIYKSTEGEFLSSTKFNKDNTLTDEQIIENAINDEVKPELVEEITDVNKLYSTKIIEKKGLKRVLKKQTTETQTIETDQIKTGKPLTENQKEISEFFGIDINENNQTDNVSENIVINSKKRKQIGGNISNVISEISKTSPSKSINTNTLVNQVVKAVKATQKLFPNVKVILHENTDLYKKNTDNSISRGEFNPNTNSIHIDMSEASPTTVAHEFFHAVLLNKIKTDTQVGKITADMVASVKKTLKSDSELMKQLDEFSSNYETDLQNEEKMAELIGIMASQFKNNKLTKPQQNIIVKWIQDLGRRLGLDTDFLGGLNKTEEATIDLLNTLAKKLRTGEEITTEDVKILDETPPKDLTFDQYVKRQTRNQKQNVAAEDFNLDELEVISKGGSGRIVYQHPDVNKVIKVATSPRGLEQNLSMGFGDFNMLDGQVAELFEQGLDYIVTEKVPRNDKVVNKFLKPLKKFSAMDFKDGRSRELIELLEDMGLTDFRNYNLLWGDFIVGRNWGVRKNGEIVLVDEGALNDKVYYGSKIEKWAQEEWQDIKSKRGEQRRKTKSEKPRAKRKQYVRLETEAEVAKAFNFNEKGFISASSSLDYIKARLPEGFTARRAKKTPFGGGGISVYDRNNRRLNPRKKRKQLDPKKESLTKLDISLEDYVKQARDAGFTDARIKDFLVNVIRKFKAKEVSEALKSDVPKSFTNMKGGVNAGKSLIKKIKTYQTKLINQNKKRKNPLSQSQIADKVIEYTESLPEFKKEADTYKKGAKIVKRKGLSKQQANMLSELQSILEDRPTATMASRIRTIKTIASSMARGERTLQQVKRDLKNYMRRHLPKSTYTKSETMALVREIEKATQSNFQDVLNRVNSLVVKKNVSLLNNNIDSILKDTYTRVTSGLKKGVKISNDIRKRIEKIKKDSGFNQTLTAKDIVEKKQELLTRFDEINKKTNKLTDTDLADLVDIQTSINLLEAKLLEDTNLSKVEILNSANQNLTDMIEFGKAELAMDLQEAHEKYRQDLSLAYNEITGKKIDPNDPQFKTKLELETNLLKDKQKNKADQQNNLKKAMSFLSKKVGMFFNQAEALDGLMDLISILPGEIFGGKLQKLVTQRVDAASIIFKRRRMQTEKMMQNKLKELLGKDWAKKSRKYRKKIKLNIKSTEAVSIAQKLVDENPSPENKAKLKEAINSSPTYTMSPNEMYYLYNQFKDPANHPSFKAKFKDNYKGVMKDITNILEKDYPELKKFADWQVNEMFPTLYEHYNNVYKKIYRTDMPWNQNYAGRIYKQGVDTTPINLIGQTGASIGVNQTTGKSTHLRTDNASPIEIMDGTDALLTYLNDMEYFAAFAEPINYINKIFSNDNIKKSINTIHGNKDISGLINNLIQRVAQRGTTNVIQAKIFNYFNNAFLISRLALSPVITLKQLTSTFTYANDIGIVNWTKYAFKNLKDIRKTWKEIRDNSVYMQDREYDSIMKNIESYNTESMLEFVPGNTKQMFLNFLMWTTKFGDRSAIMLGGMPNYNFYKDQYRKANPKATEKEVVDHAISKFEKDTKRTQQSGDIQDKDYFQTGDPWMRAANMFMTTPKQYLRKEIQAVRNLYRKAKGGKDAGKGTIWENTRTFAMYHIGMPVLFQYVAMGLPGLLRPKRDEDLEDLGRAALIGNLNSLFLAGELLTTIADAVQGKPWDFAPKAMGALTITGNIIKKGKRFSQAQNQLEKYRTEGKTDKAIAQQGKVDKALMDFVAELTTVGPSPAPSLLKYWRNVGKLNDPNVTAGEAIARILNYSEYQMAKPPKKEKKKKIPLRDLKILDPTLYRQIMEEKEREKNTAQYKEEQRRKKYEREMYERELRKNAKK